MRNARVPAGAPLNVTVYVSTSGSSPEARMERSSRIASPVPLEAAAALGSSTVHLTCAASHLAKASSSAGVCVLSTASSAGSCFFDSSTSACCAAVGNGLYFCGPTGVSSKSAKYAPRL